MGVFRTKASLEFSATALGMIWESSAQSETRQKALSPLPTAQKTVQQDRLFRGDWEEYPPSGLRVHTEQ